MEGVWRSTAEVTIFLDSHIEALDGTCRQDRIKHKVGTQLLYVLVGQLWTGLVSHLIVSRNVLYEVMRQYE